MVEKRTPGQRLIEGATEALAVARGEQPAAAIWIDGHQYVPAEEIQRLRAEVDRLRKIISDCADATGAFVAPTCSLEFMEGLPNEIRLSRAGLRAEAMERAAQIIDEGYDRGIKMKQDTCAHGKFQWEDCDSCASAAIRAEASKKGSEG